MGDFSWTQLGKFTLEWYPISFLWTTDSLSIQAHLLCVFQKFFNIPGLLMVPFPRTAKNKLVRFFFIAQWYAVTLPFFWGGGGVVVLLSLWVHLFFSIISVGLWKEEKQMDFLSQASWTGVVELCFNCSFTCLSICSKKNPWCYITSFLYTCPWHAEDTKQRLHKE